MANATLTTDISNINTANGYIIQDFRVRNAFQAVINALTDFNALGYSKLSRQISSAGINPGAAGAVDSVLAIYSIPAGYFASTGIGVGITASGSFASNTNAKTLKIFFNPTAPAVGSTVSGGTAIATTGAVTTNGGGWQIAAEVFKYGAAASNTQLAIHSQAQVGAAVSALVAPSSLTATESAAIPIAITGACSVTTDVIFSYLEVEAFS